MSVLSIPHRSILAAALLMMASVAPAGAADAVIVAPAARTGLSLTVYQQGFALIRDVRTSALAAGRNALALTGVSGRLDPATVQIALDKGAVVASFGTAGELLSPQALLRRAFGTEVTVVRTNPATGEDQARRARVLAVRNGIVLAIDGRIETLPATARLVYDSVPDDLWPTPTVLASVEARRADRHNIDMSYLSDGIGWRADYTAQLDATAERIDLTGWATVTNNTTAAYIGADLALVAGTVNRRAVRPMLRERAVQDAPMRALAAPSPPQPQPVGDFYLYRLPDAADLAAGATRRIRLLGATGVPITRTLHTTGSPQPGLAAGDPVPQPVAVRLSFENVLRLGLGTPLPAGTLRALGNNDGAPVFLGEATIAATPEGQKVEAEIGQAFDVTARRHVVAFRQYGTRGENTETTQRLVLANAAARAATIEVVETFRGTWRMLDESAPHTRTSAFAARWRIAVPAGGETTLEYRVQITRR